jgi:hypothetical protein
MPRLEAAKWSVVVFGAGAGPRRSRNIVSQVVVATPIGSNFLTLIRKADPLHQIEKSRIFPQWIDTWVALDVLVERYFMILDSII